MNNDSEDPDDPNDPDYQGPPTTSKPKEKDVSPKSNGT